MISSRAVAGTRSLSSRRLPLLPRRGSPALTVPGWLRRVRGCVCRCRGWARAPRRAFWASRVRPAPVRVPSSRVPARRFKDPGGSPYRPRGRGAVGPVGTSVVRGRASRSLPTSGAPSDSAGHPSGRRRFPRRRFGGRVASPLWAPEGFPARAPGLSRPLAGRRRVPGSWRPVSRVSRLSVSDPVFFFFISYVSRFVSRWPA